MKSVVWIVLVVAVLSVKSEAQPTWDSMKVILDNDIAIRHTAIVNQQNAAKLSNGHYAFNPKNTVKAAGKYDYWREYHEYPMGWIAIYRYERNDTVMIRTECIVGHATWRNMPWTLYTPAEAAPAILPPMNEVMGQSKRP